MKRITTVAILTILAVSTVLISCAKEPEAPVSYASHRLRDVAFNYPRDWIEQTPETPNSKLP